MKAKKVMALALAAVMLICTSVAATIAYLTDDDVVVNTFTVGKVEIKLDEAKVNENGNPIKEVVDTNDIDKDGDTAEKIWVETDRNDAPRVTENAYHLLPGLPYTKDPTVTVLKNSEDCYVRMLVTFSFSKELDEILPNADLTAIFNEANETDWELFKVVEDETANTRTYEFRYKNVVAKNPTADTKVNPLFTGLIVPGNLENDDLAKLVKVVDGEIVDQMQITVVAHAIQAAGFADSVQAWNNF